MRLGLPFEAALDIHLNLVKMLKGGGNAASLALTLDSLPVPTDAFQVSFHINCVPFPYCHHWDLRDPLPACATSSPSLLRKLCCSINTLIPDTISVKKESC